MISLPLFTYSIIPGVKICEWKSKGRGMDHRYQKLWNMIAIEIKGETVLLCQYCFIIFFADSISLLEKNGCTKEQIKELLPRGPTNTENLPKTAEDRKEMREIYRRERKAKD